MSQQGSITPSKAPEEDPPCTICSWTKKRQRDSRYESHIKLFFHVSDRAVWSLGPNYVIKERGTKPPSFENRSIRFLKENTSIPVPNVILEDNYDNDRSLTVLERVPGVTLDTVWNTMSTADKERIAQQTASYLSQLRRLQSPRMQSLGEQPLYETFLFLDGFGVPHGPLASDEDLWAVLSPLLKDLPENVQLRMRQRMPSSAPFTFTHGDMYCGNIMVQDGQLTGILDWEWAGYFPVWWEFTSARRSLSETDTEWKTLLRKYLEPHQAASDFWRDLYFLRKYPELDEEGKRILEELMSDEATE